MLDMVFVPLEEWDSEETEVVRRLIQNPAT